MPAFYQGPTQISRTLVGTFDGDGVSQWLEDLDWYFEERAVDSSEERIFLMGTTCSPQIREAVGREVAPECWDTTRFGLGVAFMHRDPALIERKAREQEEREARFQAHMARQQQEEQEALQRRQEEEALRRCESEQEFSLQAIFRCFQEKEAIRRTCQEMRDSLCRREQLARQEYVTESSARLQAVPVPAGAPAVAIVEAPAVTESRVITAAEPMAKRVSETRPPTPPPPASTSSLPISEVRLLSSPPSIPVATTPSPAVKIETPLPVAVPLAAMSPPASDIPPPRSASESLLPTTPPAASDASAVILDAGLLPVVPVAAPPFLQSTLESSPVPPSSPDPPSTPQSHPVVPVVAKPPRAIGPESLSIPVDIPLPSPPLEEKARIPVAFEEVRLSSTSAVPPDIGSVQIRRKPPDEDVVLRRRPPDEDGSQRRGPPDVAFRRKPPEEVCSLCPAAKAPDVCFLVCAHVRLCVGGSTPPEEEKEGRVLWPDRFCLRSLPVEKVRIRIRVQLAARIREGAARKKKKKEEPRTREESGVSFVARR